MANRKYTKEFKLDLIKKHVKDGISYYKLEKDNSIAFGTIRHWTAAYNAFGEDGLIRKNSNRCNYTASFKERVVKEYLAGGITYQQLALKYSIHAESSVKVWVEQYNSHEELTDSRKNGDSDMAKQIKSRSTTLEERIKIVEYCISSSNNYSETAKKFNCSYDQVYSWVKKYNSLGVDGLIDGRGHNKDEAELSEAEKLRVENRLLRAEMKKQEMEIALLKKLEEIERR